MHHNVTSSATVSTRYDEILLWFRGPIVYCVAATHVCKPSLVVGIVCAAADSTDCCAIQDCVMHALLGSMTSSLYGVTQCKKQRVAQSAYNRQVSTIQKVQCCSKDCQKVPILGFIAVV